MNKYNSIQYMNVYSKEYITSYTNVETCMREFMELCQKNKLRSSGNFFYAIHQINEKADMRIEFFFPAKDVYKRQVDTMLEDLKRQPNVIAGELKTSIDVYNRELPSQLSNRLEEFAKKIAEANPGLKMCIRDRSWNL